MTTPLFPNGYDGPNRDGMGDLRTMEGVERRTTVQKLDDEFWRRFRALMLYAEVCGVALGVGTGQRDINPIGSTFAANGNSNHQSFPWQSFAPNAVAIDAVPPAGLDFMERHALAFGLRTFRRGGVSSPDYAGQNEPWHVQPIEIPYGRSWRTEPWTLPRFPLPYGDDSTPPPAPVAEPLTVPLTNPRTLVPLGPPDTMTGYDVIVVQSLLCGISAADLVVDGVYGMGTAAAMADYQRKVGLDPDMRCGPVTRSQLVNGKPGSPNDAQVLRLRADSGTAGYPVVVAQSLLRYRFGATEVLVDGRYGPVATAAVRRAQAVCAITVDGHVGPATWSRFLNG